MSIKLDLKEMIKLYLQKENEDMVLFYHFVKFDLSKNLVSGQFVKNESFYHERDNIKNLWFEGLSFLFEIYGYKISLIENIFSNIKKKYSFHAAVTLKQTKTDPVIKIEVDGRDIFIQAELPDLNYWESYDSVKSFSQKEGLFEDYFDAVWSTVEQTTMQKDILSADLKNKIEKGIEGQVSINFREHNLKVRITEAVKILLYFLYPTKKNPAKQYSVFVNPSFVTKEEEVTSGGIAIFLNNTEFDAKFHRFRIELARQVSLWATYETIEDLLIQSEYNNLKLAITSILIDSYSHNISAHSLSALQWWFRERSEKSLEQKIWLGGFPRINGIALNDLDREDLQNLNRQQMSHLATNGSGFNVAYYEQLGLEDHTNTIDYTSLMDYLRFLPKRIAERDFGDNLNFIPYIHATDVKERSTDEPGKTYLPRLPMPLDFAIHPLLRYLKEKGAFWSGVLRDNAATPGQHINLYELLYEEFINNPLFLGTIAHSEGINKVNFILHLEEPKANNSFFEDKKNGKDFVSIDLSLIQKSASRETELQRSMTHVQQPVDRSQEKAEPSELAFVRLGKDFEALRELMQSHNYIVFLPGNVTGKHALLTIMENTLRNIKHYDITDEIRKNGINFHISVRNEHLFDQHVKDAQRDKSGGQALWRFGIWLGHEFKAKKYTQGQMEGIWGEKQPAVTGDSVHEVTFLADMFLRSIESVVDTQGRARLGGNSQDKVCAASLLRHQFSKVEGDDPDPNKQILQRYYYPWLRFGTFPEPVLASAMEGQLLESGAIEDALKTSLENWQREATLQHLYESCGKITNEKSSGFLKKYFFLWRGDELGDMRDKPSDESRLTFLRRQADNLSRYRLLVVRNSAAFTLYRQMGVVRMLKLDGLSKNVTSFYDAYCQWVTFWSEGKPDIFDFYRLVSQEDGSEAEYKIGLSLVNGAVVVARSPVDVAHRHRIQFAHGGLGSKTEAVCDIRSHGALLQHLLADRSAGKNITEAFETLYNLANTHDGKVKLLEIFETLSTRIAIVDDRIFNKFQRYSIAKRKNIFRHLNLQVYNEGFESGHHGVRVMKIDGVDYPPENTVNKTIPINDWWIGYGETQFKMIDQKLHILIIHLSFIEKLGYSEKNVSKFIRERILQSGTGAKLADNFLFGITTGRGRSEWWETIKSDPLLHDKVVFIPIEALESAVETAIVYGDDFQIKYNICKIIFGS